MALRSATPDEGRTLMASGSHAGGHGQAPDREPAEAARPVDDMIRDRLCTGVFVRSGHNRIPPVLFANFIMEEGGAVAQTRIAPPHIDAGCAP